MMTSIRIRSKLPGKRSRYLPCACYDVSGTDAAYGTIRHLVRVWCYEAPGTDVAYGARPSYGKQQTTRRQISYGTRIPIEVICLRTSYAMSGTELRLGATSRPFRGCVQRADEKDNGSRRHARSRY
eukprot:3940572-Rhodomonas_salina.2